MAETPENTAAMIEACKAADIVLRGEKDIWIAMNDASLAGRVIGQLAKIAATAMMAAGKEAGLDEDAARDNARAWLAQQTTACEMGLLDAGLIYDPAMSMITPVPAEAP